MMKKQTKGITLIALVITIIILLILAGITINLTVGQRGILTRAQEAGRNYQEAAKREDEELAKFWGEAKNIINGNNGSNSSSGGSEVGTTPQEPEISEEVRGLKSGDYIKYDTGVGSVGEKGVIVCRVLYPVDSEYGLQIISNNNVGDNIRLGKYYDWEESKVAYNGAIKTLNAATEKYVNPAYAYDARCVGSDPTTSDGMFVNKDNGEKSTVILPADRWNISDYKRPKNWDTDDTGCYADMNYTWRPDVDKIKNWSDPGR